MADTSPTQVSAGPAQQTAPPVGMPVVYHDGEDRLLFGPVHDHPAVVSRVNDNGTVDLVVTYHNGEVTPRYGVPQPGITNDVAHSYSPIGA